MDADHTGVPSMDAAQNGAPPPTPAFTWAYAGSVLLVCDGVLTLAGSGWGGGIPRPLA